MMKETDAGLTVIICVVGVPVTVSVKLADAVFPAASVAVSEKLETPGVVGVPVTE